LKKILVTGGAGYIGSVITEVLQARGFAPVVLDNLSQGHLDALAPGTEIVVADLQDRHAVEEVFAKQQIDAVIHMAAVSVVSDSVRQPLKYYLQNVGGLINLLLAMRGAGVNTIVFSSTAAVYGIPDAVPITEKAAMRPINPYGWSKMMCEQVLADAGAAHGVKWVALRYFNVAGATERCGEWHTPETHLIPRVFEVAEGQRSHVEVYGTNYDTPDGTCIRDYIHVLDLADAHILALEAAARSGGIYNLGTSNGHSVREVLQCAEKIAGKKIAAREQPPRLGDPARLVASFDRIHAEAGWTPKRTLEDVMRGAWDWRRKHPNGYPESSPVEL